MESKLLGGLAALAIVAAATAPAAARGFGGFGGGRLGGGMGGFSAPHPGGGFGGFGGGLGGGFGAPHLGGGFMGPRPGLGGGGMFMPGGRPFGRPFMGRPGFPGHAFRHHHGFHRFAYLPFGGYGFYNYGVCWRRAWTPYGWRWVNVCYDYIY